MVKSLQVKIQKYIEEHGEATPKLLISHFQVSAVTVHHHLKALIKQNTIQKFGVTPRVFYRIVYTPAVSVSSTFTIGNDIHHGATMHFPRVSIAYSKLINENFYTISPSGTPEFGIVAFYHWVTKRKLDFVKTAQQYADTVKKYESLKNPLGLIDATQKIQESFPGTKLKKMYYVDFYSYPVFGKTKLGTLLLNAKQTMDIDLIEQTIEVAKPKILAIIKKHAINALAFVPPTISRKVQFMTELEKAFENILPIVKLEKIRNTIAIQQKTLKIFDDRVENAQNTIFVGDERHFKNVLIVDDAVGSGATIAVVSRKLLRQKTAQNTYAVSIVGSANAKQFEVINEI